MYYGKGPLSLSWPGAVQIQHCCVVYGSWYFRRINTDYALSKDWLLVTAGAEWLDKYTKFKYRLTEL